MTVSKRIEPGEVRYIKLGEGGAWESLCFETNTVRFGGALITDDLAQSQLPEAIAQRYRDVGVSPGVASRYANEINLFYTLPEDTLWITFANGLMYWCFAEPKVYLTGHADESEGEKQEGFRYRKCVDRWSCTDVQGRPLRMSELSGALVKTAAYRGTICAVEQGEYAIRRINCDQSAVLTSLIDAKAALIRAATTAIAHLHWKDFELLVELVFAQSGWRRVSSTGGFQKVADIEVELPSTGELAFIQVKTSTSQAELDEYVGEREKRGSGTRMFYVYHTSPTDLQTADQSTTLVDMSRIAEMCVDAGLVNWLAKKQS